MLRQTVDEMREMIDLAISIATIGRIQLGSIQTRQHLGLRSPWSPVLD